MNVWVQNTGTEEVKASWDGVLYEMPPGSTVEVPVHLAHAYFGYDDTDKEQAVMRLGWVQTANDMPAALERLAAFHVTRDKPEDCRSLSPAAVRAFPGNSKRVVGGARIIDAAKA